MRTLLAMRVALLAMVARFVGVSGLFTGIPTACQSGGPCEASGVCDGSSDTSAVCTYDCATGGECSVPGDTTVCCSYYPAMRTTAVDDIVALGYFANECDHHNWHNHRIDWCAGYKQNG